MPKRLSALSDMTIDEVSLVDKGANQFSHVVIAKNYDVGDVFSKARGTDQASLERFTGTDITDLKQGDKEKKNAGPGGTISGVQRIRGESVPNPKKKVKQAENVDGDETDEQDPVEKGFDFDNLDDSDYELAKSLGLVEDDYDDPEDDQLSFELPDDAEVGDVLEDDEGNEYEVLGDEEEVGKGLQFGQQGQTPPQFGVPPNMQSGGAMPMGMGAPQPPPMGMPGQMPGMGQPQMPGMGQPGMGMGQQMPGMGQLPPDVLKYIQYLEQQVAQGNGGQNKPPESQDSNSSSSDSDSNKNPFGKAADMADIDLDRFTEELSKALNSEEDRETITKAFQQQNQAYQHELSKRDAALGQLTELAKSERDLRLEREFISKAQEDFCTLPIDPEELGPVLKRAAETLDEEDFSVLVKCLDAAATSADVFGEIGNRGNGSNGDVFEQVEAFAKSLDGNVTPEEAVSKAFEVDPGLYDAYLQDQRNNRL